MEHFYEMAQTAILILPVVSIKRVSFFSPFMLSYIQLGDFGCHGYPIKDIKLVGGIAGTYR